MVCIIFSTLDVIVFPKTIHEMLYNNQLYLFNLQTVQTTCCCTKETVSRVLTSVAESSPVLQVSVSVRLTQRLLRTVPLPPVTQTEDVQVCMHYVHVCTFCEFDMIHDATLLREMCNFKGNVALQRAKCYYKRKVIAFFHCAPIVLFYL